MSGDDCRCKDHNENSFDCECYQRGLEHIYKEPSFSGPQATITFDIEEHRHQYHVFSQSQRMYSILSEIQDHCRTKIKHGDNEKVADFAQEIRDMLDGVLWAIEER